MAFDYYKLEPHRYDLVPSNRYQVGRSGKKPRYIVRHHLMMVNATGEAVRGVWLDRVASAHYTVQGAAGRLGQISQHVYDSNTAYANADWNANLESYTIEHSNNSGRFNGSDYHDKAWNIADEVIIAGARWAAALLVHDKMGAPVYGPTGTIRDHNMFTPTGCPVHLSGPHGKNPFGGKAGKYHYPWMEEAKSFYNDLSKKLVNPDGTPIKHGFTPPKEESKEVSFTDADRKMLREVHHELTHRFDSRYDLERLRRGEITERQVFKESQVGYALEADRKIEDVHANMLPAIYDELTEIKAKLEKEGK
ncbi:N-acetylmuramoyl-L-alanine amidase [Pasteurella phage PMP-GADVASU-IND]|nr:N-acetylmuramoyl-L-alanine amidase [Pasteurella phage PMP-GADVASU-IND]